MSFTIKVKEELLGLGKKDKTELSAIIKMSGSLGISSQGLTLSITTGNAKIARHIYELLAAFYQVKSDIRHHQKANLRKNRVYTVFLDEGVEQILADLHLADSFFGIEAGIDQAILSDDEASRAYLRGAFLSTGSMRDPDSGKYQLEILSVYSDHAEDLAALMRKFLLDAKTIERKKGSVTYLQRAEDIMDRFVII
jgi:cell division protein WhiA